MQHVIDELSKSHRYHLRQLDDNLNKIKFSEESIESLKQANLKHKEAIEQIETLLEQLEKTEKAAT
jgi:hypothetical protein